MDECADEAARDAEDARGAAKEAAVADAEVASKQRAILLGSICLAADEPAWILRPRIDRFVLKKCRRKGKVV
ncbi:hypothetical protein E4U11_007270 [Claviceps purpurea]|nr:hypothetical protein E4U11_007270 [Claviceps purpurea]